MTLTNSLLLALGIIAVMCAVIPMSRLFAAPVASVTLIRATGSLDQEHTK